MDELTPQQRQEVEQLFERALELAAEQCITLLNSSCNDPAVRAEVESLLAHWETRVPCGPCHYGIGGRFMQVEFPFLRYNLFYYVYVLSFFPAARADSRFAQAAKVLASKADPAGIMVVEQPSRPQPRAG